MAIFRTTIGQIARPASFKYGLFACLLLGFAGGAVAAEMPALYEAEVPVEGQGSAHRTQAIIKAFRQVLVKVTGNRSIPAHPRLAGDIPMASRYVQQYRYRLEQVEPPEEAPPTEQGEDTPVSSTPAPPEPKRFLNVRFDERAVNRLLHQRELPVWGATRPATLLWLAGEQNGWRSMVIPEEDESIRQPVMATARERGISLLFPLMDLEDRSRLEVSDIWGGFGDSIRQASRRYGPDAVVAGRLIQYAPDLWRARWTLYLGDETSAWDGEGVSRESVTAEGMQQVVDMLAARFAPVPGGRNLSRLLLHVSGVGDLKGYANIGRYLSDQEVVERADLWYAEPDALTYVLQVRGGQRAFTQSMALTGFLEPLPGGETGVTLSPSSESPSTDGPEGARMTTLYYRLRP